MKSRPMPLAFLAASLFLLIMIHGCARGDDRVTDCSTIKNFFGPSRFDHVRPPEDLVKRFTAEKVFSNGKGGATVIAMMDRDGRKWILKIYQQHAHEIKPLEEVKDYREAYLTCTNSNHSSASLAEVFPTLLEVGNTTKKNPFDEDEQPSGEIYPYIISEFFDGVDMLKVASDPKAAEKKIGFSYSGAHIKDTVGMLWQIAIAMDEAHKSDGFRHNDLHPENIIVIREETGLRAKIFDFGLGTNKDLPKLPLYQKRRPGNAVTMEFIETLYKKNNNGYFTTGYGKVRSMVAMAFLSTLGNGLSDFNHFNAMLIGLNDLINAGKEAVLCYNWDQCKDLSIFKTYGFRD